MVRRTLDSKSLAQRCADLAGQKKASDVVILDVKDIFSMADYFIICGGNSDRQVRAIASFVEETLEEEGVSPLGVEGMTEGRWVLMDLNEVIIHIFQEDIRSFYDLEGLWRDAPRVEFQVRSATGRVMTRPGTP